MKNKKVKVGQVWYDPEMKKRYGKEGYDYIVVLAKDSKTYTDSYICMRFVNYPNCGVNYYHRGSMKIFYGIEIKDLCPALLSSISP